MFTVNTDSIFASIEFFCIIISFFVILLFLTLVGTKKKSGLFLVLAVTGNIAMLLSDVLWNIFDGDASEIGIIMNRVINVVTFLSNAFSISMSILYVYEVLREKGEAVKKTFFRFMLSVMIVIMLLTAVNIFIPILYNFTEANEYYRLPGWFAYTGCILFTLVSGLVYLIVRRNKFDRPIYISLLIFYGLPCVGSVLQAVFGGAFVNVGSTIGLLVIAFVYINKWVATGEWDEHSKNKSFTVFTNLFLILSVCMIAAVFASFMTMKNTYDDQQESNSKVIAHTVNESIENAFVKPITVARTMSNSSNLKSSLMNDKNLKSSDEDYELVNYLLSIKEGMEYQMVFAISNKTMAYYSCNGLNRYLDPDNDAHDVWYSSFILSNKDCALNVDTDEDNDQKLAVFVNKAVKDENGNKIGVCGVGVSMTELEQLVSSIEENYGVTVKLINEGGLVQVASDESSIEKEYLDVSYLDKVSSDEFLYEDRGEAVRLTKYMDDFDWYLVIEEPQGNIMEFVRTIMPSVIVLIFGIGVLIVIFFAFRGYWIIIDRAITEKEYSAGTDELTGISNRYALEKYRTAKHDQDWKNNLAIIMMDVNGLKSLNDTKGHSAGDELLVSTASCISRVTAHAYRIGGDEFRIYIEDSTQEKLDEMLEKLRTEFDSCRGESFDSLTVSIGSVLGSENESCSLDELEEIADERMYKDKENYYKVNNLVRRER